MDCTTTHTIQKINGDWFILGGVALPQNTFFFPKLYQEIDQRVLSEDGIAAESCPFFFFYSLLNI